MVVRIFSLSFFGTTKRRQDFSCFWVFYTTNEDLYIHTRIFFGLMGYEKKNSVRKIELRLNSKTKQRNVRGGLTSGGGGGTLIKTETGRTGSRRAREKKGLITSVLIPSQGENKWGISGGWLVVGL